MHDLEITARLLARPSEFVHFLARRRRAAQTNRILANDELDYLMHYLKLGLFSDGPQLGPQLVMSLTDELDAWYFSEIGEVAAGAPKPAQPIAPDLSDVLGLLEQHRPDLWLEASMHLLDLDAPLREQVSGAPRGLRAQTRVDRQSHSMHVAVNEFGFVAMSFPRGMRANEMATRLSGYTRLRRYASGIDTVYAFGSWQGSSAAFDIFLSDHEPWVFNEELDRLVSEAGLTVSDRPSSPAA